MRKKKEKKDKEIVGRASGWLCRGGARCCCGTDRVAIYVRRTEDISKKLRTATPNEPPNRAPDTGVKSQPNIIPAPAALTKSPTIAPDGGSRRSATVAVVSICGGAPDSPLPGPGASQQTR